MSVGNCDVDLLTGEILDLQCADVVLLFADTQVMQSAPSQLVMNVLKYGMCFAPCKSKVLLKD